MKLAGRVAIVTGASRGIGREVALKLAREGADIVVAAKTVEPHPKLPGTIHTVAEEIRALGRRALPVQTDIRKEQDIEALLEAVGKEFGRIDILVNNAGALWWYPVENTPPKRFDLIMDVNVRGAFLTSRAVLPAMKKQRWGHIINMSPPIDLKVLPGKVAYMISKFGMTMVAHGLAEEVKSENIAVNALWPVTLIESLATINFGVGGPENWRKADILADATFAIVSKGPSERTGQALLDEDVLAADGVTDFDKYACVPGSTPMRIHWHVEAGKPDEKARVTK